VGRASNRKKARRQQAVRPAAHRTQRVRQGSPADAGRQQAELAVAAAREAIELLSAAPRRQQIPKYRAWCSEQPIPAEVQRWAEGSLGERLCSGMYLSSARNAPCLLTATVPDRMAIIIDPAQWRMAAAVLVRAVVFDALRVDHPAVSRLLDVLAPIAVEELEHEQALEDFYSTGWDEEKPEFPEDDGPVWLIGSCALGDATLAVVGEDPRDEVSAALSPVLDGTVPGLDGRAVADVLTGGRVTPYLCKLPDHVLKRMHRVFDVGGALHELADARVVPPRDILRVGLKILSALAELCKSDSPSILRQRAISVPPGTG
jgi:hypothetical protein